ncbi:MFS transporter [Micrococcales bacterium 31B]|nr:MFS transporter [Micrococcales bacterium 31B]
MTRINSATSRPRGRTFQSLAIPNYRYWFFGSLLASTGTWMQRVAQDWLVLTELTDNDGTITGIVIGLQFLPMLVLAPLTGTVTDRVPRRHLLMVTQGAQGVLALALGIDVLLGHVQMWHMLIFATLLGIVTAFDNPGRQTIVSELVGAKLLSNAVALNTASFNLARMIGPAVAGLLIGWVGSGWVFLINAVSFAATIAALFLIKTRGMIPIQRAGRGRMRDGLRYVRGRPDLILIMCIMGVIGMLGLNFQLTSAMMSTQVFGVDASLYGILGSVLSIGSLMGSLLAARRLNPTIWHVLGAACAFGVVTTVAAFTPNFWFFAVVCIGTGLATATLLNSGNAVVQLSTGAHMRGRVMALYMALLMGTTPFGSPLIGWIGSHWGARWSIAVGGIAALVVGLLGIAIVRHRPGIVELMAREREANRPQTATIPHVEPTPGLESEQWVEGIDLEQPEASPASTLTRPLRRS